MSVFSLSEYIDVYVYMYIYICMYNALQHTATHCNTLQHTATHCNTLQHTDECDTHTHIRICIYTYPPAVLFPFSILIPHMPQQMATQMQKQHIDTHMYAPIHVHIYTYTLYIHTHTHIHTYTYTHIVRQLYFRHPFCFRFPFYFRIMQQQIAMQMQMQHMSSKIGSAVKKVMPQFMSHAL